MVTRKGFNDGKRVKTTETSFEYDGSKMTKKTEVVTEKADPAVCTLCSEGEMDDGSLIESSVDMLMEDTGEKVERGIWCAAGIATIALAFYSICKLAKLK